MMRSSTWWTRVSGLAVMVALGACASDPVRPNDSVPTRIVLEVAGRDLSSVGDSALVRPVVYDQHGTPMSGTQIEWSLSTEGVVELLGNGVLRAVGNGDVLVRAAVRVGETGVRPAGYWADPVAASVALRVQQQAARLVLAPVDTIFTTVNAVRRLSVTVVDARGNPMRTPAQPIVFQSVDGEVANVDATGAVRSRRLGSTRVTARLADLQAGLTFVVDPRLAHTACMVYAKRRRSNQQCVTNGFIVHAPVEAR